MHHTAACVRLTMRRSGTGFMVINASTMVWRGAALTHSRTHSYTCITIKWLCANCGTENRENASILRAIYKTQTHRLNGPQHYNSHSLCARERALV